MVRNVGALDPPVHLHLKMTMITRSVMFACSYLLLFENLNQDRKQKFRVDLACVDNLCIRTCLLEMGVR